VSFSLMQSVFIIQHPVKYTSKRFRETNHNSPDPHITTTARVVDQLRRNGSVDDEIRNEKTWICVITNGKIKDVRTVVAGSCTIFKCREGYKTV